jgi:leader peptidase (prepilin peptidase) / N-methyltransferase
MDLARDARSEARGDAPEPRALLASGRGWTGAGACFVAALAFIRFGFSGEAFVGALFAAVVVVLAAIDLEQRIVPDRIVLPATAVVLAAQLALHPGDRLSYVVAALGAALLLFLPRLAYPGGMGLGDVKLAMLLGAGLGSSVLVAFVASFLAAFVVAVGILIAQGFSGRKIGIPFAPFLAAGGLVALLFA